MTGLGAPFISSTVNVASPPPFTSPVRLPHPTPRSSTFSNTLHFWYSFFQDLRHFFSCTPLVSGSLSSPAHPPLSTITTTILHIPFLVCLSVFLFFFFFHPLSKFSVHCPPDSHPSTWAQFKKPFNSCHSTGLAISPAAKAQTGTLLQQATLNVRLVSSPPPAPSPIPNRTEGERLYFFKDWLSWRQGDWGEVERSERGRRYFLFLTCCRQHLARSVVVAWDK